VFDAVLVMARYRVTFFTSYAVDLALPAWLCVTFRRTRASGASWWRRALAVRPVVLALVNVAASTATGICQYFSPRRPFPGRFDPLDLVAYVVGTGLCDIADLRWAIASHVAAEPPTP
jgi:hypothetical protein